MLSSAARTLSLLDIIRMSGDLHARLVVIRFAAAVLAEMFCRASDFCH